MVAPRRKHLAASRRRLDDEGEDEDDSITAGVEDDSMSEEGSALSDADDDADAEGSEVSGMDGSQPQEIRVKTSANGRSETVSEKHKPPTAASKQSSFAAMTSDTAAMMNGLSLSTAAEDAEEINFDDIAKVTQSQPPASASTPADKDSHPTYTLGDKRRQEHEEYKRKRDADPSFVPNRGGFFMHDHRSVAPGQNGFRPYGRGRGRGRGAIPPTGYVYEASKRLSTRH